MNSFKPTHGTNEPSLDERQMEIAKTELIKSASMFPKVNRRFEDPIVPGQPKFALFSFVEFPDREMDEFISLIGNHLPQDLRDRLRELKDRKCVVKGVGKIRGAFNTQEEAAVRAEEIVRDVDSTNTVYTCLIGTPFPLVSRGFSEEVVEVDLRSEVEHALATNVRNQRKREEKEMEEIKRREEELLRDSEKDPNADDQENYITHRVKLAHLKYSISQHSQKRSECVEKAKQCMEWLLKMKEAHPEYEEKYMEHYMKGRKAAHIKDEDTEHEFMKLMKDPLLAIDLD